MIKKTITYKDFNGNENTDTFYFNLSEAELSMMEVRFKGGLSNYIKEAVDAGDNAKLISLFNDVLLEAYGIKSEDGKKFVKSEAIKEDFKSSAAFSKIFMSVCTDEKEADAFIKGIINQ